MQGVDTLPLGVPDFSAANGSVDVSSGTVRADSVYTAGEYVPESWIPRRPWLPLPPAGMHRLNARVSGASEPPVLLLRDASLSALVGVIPRQIRNLVRVEDGQLHRTDRFLDALLSRLPDLRRLLGEQVVFAPTTEDPVLGCREPGLETATRDYTRGNLRLGLHIDSRRYYRSWNDRRRAPWLFCLNVGAEDRFFLFVPASLDDLVRRLNSDPKVHDELARAPGRFTGQYLSLFPETEIYRLRVRPGEAYVAPVENLIHDGSTAGNTFLDLTLNLRGSMEYGTRRAI